ncbi:MAG: alpha/beta family hydrolase [Mucilaginibacter sp.]
MGKSQFKPKAVLLIGRDNWQRDNGLNTVLLNYLKQTAATILWDDPAAITVYKILRHQNKIKWLPEKVMLLNLRIVQFILCLFKPGYYAYIKTKINQSVEGRVSSLEKRISAFNDQYDLTILSRSSGGVISSLLADKLAIRQLICISYPFENPNNGVEPYRFKHLEHLKTPFLIFQGTRDEYGGVEVTEKYKLSNSIELHFVDTDHNFDLSKENWQPVLSKIGAAINQGELSITDLATSQTTP